MNVAKLAFKLALGAAALTVAGCGVIAFQGIEGSGNVVKESRDVAEFSEMKVSNNIEVDYTVGDEVALDVEADDNLMEILTTEVKGGVLVIKTEKNYESSDTIRVVVTGPSLEKLDVSGASQVKVSGQEADRFDVSASGASEVEIVGRSGKVTAEASGASKVNFDGFDGETLTVEVSGASSVKGGEFVMISGELSGASQLDSKATGEVDMELSGASQGEIAGSPKVKRKDVSGASSLKIR